MHRGTLTYDRAVGAVDWQPRSDSKGGFTLVELLVVLVIIGMLASMVSFAMFRSMQAAREAKTQALISKLHNVIARHWDTFETGQIPFKFGSEPELPDPDDYPNNPDEYLADLQAYHQARLTAVREWMRYEMPDKEADLGTPQLMNAENKILIDRPLANEVIEQMGVISGNAPTDAQCLYRLATLLADDDLDRINLFSENETKDINGDGTPDIFIDGWGQPIRFIRWPAGLVTDIQDCNPTTSPDPFDPMKVGNPDPDNPLNYALFPLIYSYGPSMQSQLAPNTTGSSDPFAHTYTATSDDNDNIHNHRMNARLQ